MIYVFHGDDGFSANEALQSVLERLGPPDARESNVSHMEAAGFSVDQFGGAAMVMPFLGERRAVVIRGLLGTAEGRGRGRGRRRAAGKEDQGPGMAIVPLLSQLPPTTDVVFLDDKLAAANPALSAIKELDKDLAQVREFSMPKRDALASWIRERAQAKGVAIEHPAVALLVEAGGASLYGLDNELEKLAIYVGDRPITADDVRALVAGNRDANVFQLVDAIMDRRTGAALDALHLLLDEGATGPYLISMVARQARMVAIAQELARGKVPQGEWASRLGTTSDFVVRKTAEQARRFSGEAVRGLYRLLLEADMAMKTGESSDELALTEMLARAGGLRAAVRSGR